MNNIHIKSKYQIDKIYRSCQIAADVLLMIQSYIVPDISTFELDKIIYHYIVDHHKALPGTLNYTVGDRIYKYSSCISINHVVCHGLPNKQLLKYGDIVNIDVAVLKDGFYGDTSKMFVVENYSNVLSKRLVDVSYKCMLSGIDAVYPGSKLSNIGYNIQQIAHKNNFSIVEDFCGHGVGSNFHEDPLIRHYFCKSDSNIIMKEGMVFTIEPMINVGKKYTTLMKNGWTVITKDRSLSSQWEHTVVVDKKFGCKILTTID